MNVPKRNSSKRRWANIMIGIICIVLVIYGAFYFSQFLNGSNKSKRSEEKIEYDERFSFFKNRTLSAKDINQIKRVNLTDNYHYGVKNNLPLFYTYFQTNKYLDVNDIHIELQDLGTKINADNLDVNSLYIKSFFYTINPDKPYRTILSKFDNIHTNKPTFKQITKSRTTKSFIVKPMISDFILNVQIENKYNSGTIEAYSFELQVDKENDNIKVFDLYPSPEYVDDLSLSKFLNTTKNQGIKDSFEYILNTLSIFSNLEDRKIVYRSPLDISELTITFDIPSPEVLLIWELTFYNDVAFLRLRSDDVKGYYLVDRLNGEILQGQVSFLTKNEYITTYLIQVVPK